MSNGNKYKAPVKVEQNTDVEVESAEAKVESTEAKVESTDVEVESTDVEVESTDVEVESADVEVESADELAKKVPKYKIKKSVPSVFLNGQHHYRKDNPTFSENKEVLKKFRDGFLELIEI